MAEAQDAQFVSPASEQHVVATHKVLRNTYMLLSLTLLFSAMMAGVAMVMNAPYMGFIPILVAFGVLFAIYKLQNSVWSIPLVFLFTGILGFSLGPVVGYALSTPTGGSTVFTALSLTGMIFLSLSGYTLVTKKDFSFMSGLRRSSSSSTDMSAAEVAAFGFSCAAAGPETSTATATITRKTAGRDRTFFI